MRRAVGALLLTWFAGCASAARSPSAEPPPRPVAVPFAEGETLAYRVLDARGRSLGRTRGTFTRQDGVFTLVTRAELSGAGTGAETIEHATIHSAAFEPQLYKRLSSRRGRLELRFHDAGLALSSDIGISQVRRERVRAPVIVPEDMMLLALLIHRSAVVPGRSELLDVFRPDAQVSESVSFRMWVESDGGIVVESAAGRAHLNERWHVRRFESREGGLVFELLDAPGEPIPLQVQAKLSYTRPESADWDDREVRVPVSGGDLTAALSVPRRRARWSNRLAPPVLFVSELGPQDRHGYAADIDRGTWALQDRLAREGFIVLRLDDRGAGAGSLAPLPDAGPFARVPDLEAAFEFLLTVPEADPQRVVVVGHGAGALVAARLAARSEAAALVLVAPRYRGLEAAWSEVLSALERPVLLLAGLADFEVSWKDEAEVLHRQLVARLGKARAKFQAFDRVDHLMKEEPRTSSLERYRDASRRVDERVLEALTSWLSEQVPGL